MPRYNLRIRKLSSNPNKFNIEEFKGFADELPLVGKVFFAVSHVASDDCTYFRSSEVKGVAMINEDNRIVGYIIDTLNSRYQIDIDFVEEVH